MLMHARSYHLRLTRENRQVCVCGGGGTPFNFIEAPVVTVYSHLSSHSRVSIAIAVLKDKPPGSFLIRDSNSFQGAYGLALKVATPPPNTNSTCSKGKDGESNSMLRGVQGLSFSGVCEFFHMSKILRMLTLTMFG